MRSLTLKSALIILGAAALVFAACGGDDDASATICDDASQVLSDQPGDYAPTVISSDLAVGENRFVLGLLEGGTTPIADADLEAQFCRFTSMDEATLDSEVSLSAVTVEKSYTHLHENGEHHMHDAGAIGVYVANVDFSSAGPWQVFISGTVAGEELEPTPFLFPVGEAPLTPAIGSPAPRSVQLIIDDVADITEIDTSTPPNVEMHDMTIAEAVASGRPSVIAFATPAFCATQICGPTKEIVDSLFPTYGDRINFIHVEPYDVERARAGDCQPDLSACAVPFLFDDWGLRSEPWIFTVDANGNIAGKFEGVVGETEMEEHLQELLAS